MNGRAWTAADDAKLRELYPACATAVVAQLLSRSVKAVYFRAWALGLKKAEGCHGNNRAWRGASRAAT